MATKYDRLIEDRFGNPIFRKAGDYAGEPLVGVRSTGYDEDVCPTCHELPINGACSCGKGSMCPNCSEPVGSCACKKAMCEGCCSLGKCSCTGTGFGSVGEIAGEEPVASCLGCGLPVDQCRCDDSGCCPVCGEIPMQGACSCTLREGKKGSCSECGLRESMCQCGITEVAPPGHEKMVKGLKKAQAKGDVKNAYAVAWHHYNVKHPGGKGKKH